MKLFFFYIIATFSGIAVSGQTAKEIIDKSHAFYKESVAGEFLIMYKFKSAIANDTSISFIKGLFCREGQQLFSYITAPNAWEFVSNTEGNFSYSKYSNNFEKLSPKSLKSHIGYRIINENPFLEPDDFFRQVRSKQYKLLKRDSVCILSREESILVEKTKEEYWFDSKTYELLQYINIVDSKKYGVQYRQRSIQKFIRNESFCNKELYTTSQMIASYNLRKDSVNYSYRRSLLTEKDIGSQFPAFSVTSINDKEYNSEDLKGKYILIDLFYQSCLPCIKSLPYLNDLHLEFKEKGLVVLGVDHQLSDTLNMKAFLSRYKVDYDVIAGKDGKKFWELIKNSAFPTHILINPEGKIALLSTGMQKNFYRKIRKILSDY